MTRAAVLAIVTIAACSSGPGSSRSPVPSSLKPVAGDKPASEPAFEPARPTLRLPPQFTPTRYTAQLAIDPAKPTFDGKVAIEGTLEQRSAVIWLHGKHLTVSRATASNGTREVNLAVTPHDDLLEVRPAEPLAEGRWTLAFTYRGEIVQDGFEGAYRTAYGGEPYIVTQFETTAARLVFPCIDEPDRKASWHLTLDVPKGLVAASNTPGTSTTLDATHDRVEFEPTRPLPSYLVAFTVGPYEAIAAGNGRSGAPLRVLTPKGTTKQAAFTAGALEKIVDGLEDWLELSLPYSKLDIVLVPNLQGGAMENAGMVTADARSYLVERPTPKQQYSMVSVLGHEIAHQWFGDSVTAAWWDDIWLNESFATWSEDRVLASFDPSWPLQAMKHRASAFLADELSSARAIRQRIETDDDIHNVFDDITYPKGATVLRMLEAQLGPAKFGRAIGLYLRAHGDGIATAADLFEKLDEVAGQPLGELVTSYFDQPGLPQVAMTLSCGKQASISLEQSRYFATHDAPSSDQRWTIPICIAYDGKRHERVEKCTTLSTKTGQLVLDHCPAWFAPATDLGYYRAKLDGRALAAIRDKGWRFLTPAERVSIYNDVGARARTGDHPLELLASLGAKLRDDGNWAELAVSLGDVWAAGDGKNDGLWPGLSGVLPDSLVESARAKVRAVVEPLANKVRFTPKKRETVQDEIVRNAVLSAARWSRVRTLDAEARRLAPRYRELAASRSYVLQIAANADDKLGATLRADFATERDPELHQLLLRVLATIEDPKRHPAMMESLLGDPSLSRDERGRIWGYGDEEIRAQNEAYLRDHLDAVLATMPASESEDFPDALRLVSVFTRACDPARRDEIAGYVTAHFASIPSGRRPVAQAIERMDQCISQKKLIEPAARAWLGN